MGNKTGSHAEIGNRGNETLFRLLKERMEQKFIWLQHMFFISVCNAEWFCE